METSPQIDRDIVESFRKKLTTGIDKADVVRKLKNFNRLVKPELFNEIYSLKDVVYKRQNKNLDIEQGERNKIERMLIERDDYKQKYNRVADFVYNFKNKYSRQPSREETISNVQGIELPEMELIMTELFIQ